MSWADVQDVVKRAALADVAFDIFSSHAFMKAPPPCRYPLSIAWRMLFSSFPLRGAKPVFCDVKPETLNIDESKIEELITPRTKAISPVHYAGVGCEMDAICDIARRNNLRVVEDAAQGFTSNAPHSPAITFFVLWKLSEPKSPIVPRWRFL